MKKKSHKAGQGRAATAARLARFIELYMGNGENGTVAAVGAGYSPKTAASQASRLLTNVKVKAILAKRRAEVLNRFELTTDAVVRELARICYFDPGKCYDKKGELKSIHDIDEHTRRALAGVKDGEIKPFDKNAGLRTAFQYLRLLPTGQGKAQGAAQSLAAAEAAQLGEERHSELEIARRIAFSLVLYGNVEVKEPAKPARKVKQPA